MSPVQIFCNLWIDHISIDIIRMPQTTINKCYNKSLTTQVKMWTNKCLTKQRNSWMNSEIHATKARWCNSIRFLQVLNSFHCYACIMYNNIVLYTMIEQCKQRTNPTNISFFREKNSLSPGSFDVGHILFRKVNS